MDITTVGGSFTWSNRRAWSRIDRFLLSTEGGIFFVCISETASLVTI
jgi:hypothetical protein